LIPPRTGQPGATLRVPVFFAAESGAVSAIQFDLVHPSTVSLAGIENAPQAAGKDLYTADINQTRKRFVIVGFNATLLPNGDLVDLSVNIPPDIGAGNLTLQFANIFATSPDGTAVGVSSADALITILAGPPANPSISGVLNSASFLGGSVAPGRSSR
jgi:hypothetical protein